MKRYYSKDVAYASMFFSGCAIFSAIVMATLNIPGFVRASGSTFLLMVALSVFYRKYLKGGVWVDQNSKTVKVVNTYKSYTFTFDKIKQFKLRHRFGQLVTTEGQKIMISAISTPNEKIRPQRYQEVETIIDELNATLKD